MGKWFTRPGSRPALSIKKPSPHRKQQKTATVVVGRFKKKEKKRMLNLRKIIKVLKITSMARPQAT